MEALIGDVHIDDFPIEPHHLHIFNNEDIILDEETLYDDVRFYINIYHQSIEVRLYINIEIQNEIYPEYPLVTRGISYSSRMISQVKNMIQQVIAT